MEIAEHFYADDPAIGHPDVRTRLSDTDYFFLGNGFIHAAVQTCRSGEGTPVGLAVMDPERFGPKRAALTCDEETGLEMTAVTVGLGDSLYGPAPSELEAGWDEVEGIPAVRVSWSAGPARVVERFFCPERTLPVIARRIEIHLTGALPGPLLLQCGMVEVEARSPEMSADGIATGTLLYEIVLGAAGPAVRARWAESADPSPEIGGYWSGLAECRTGDPGLDHLFAASRRQLPTAVDHTGRMDGSIWQYNLEWVRDQSHVAEAFVRLGDQEKSRTMLARLLDDFVSPEGDTVDSGQRRSADDVELDQNGELLAALRTYVEWTGDLELVKSRWEKIRALATFPLDDRFRHGPSGLLHNRREYWERHAGLGIEDGFELMSQFFVALGLESAAYLAGLLGHEGDRDAWSRAATGLRHAMLEGPAFRLVEEGHLIKRRGTDGVWQRTVRTPEPGGLPETIPLFGQGPHLLDPDTSSALLVAHAFIDPAGELARNTLAHVEELWNQEWEGGGYGRYHAGSEADSPGAWPFASLFVARAYTETGNDDKVWRILRWLGSTPGGVAGAWFENNGPRIAPPYAQLGFTPWTWAEMITLFVHHLLGFRPDGDGLTVRPHLLEGLDRMEATLGLRGHRVGLTVRRAEEGDVRGASVKRLGGSAGEHDSDRGVERVPWGEKGLCLPLPTADLEIEIVC